MDIIDSSVQFTRLHHLCTAAVMRMNIRRREPGTRT